jgi:hypothetical protein
MDNPFLCCRVMFVKPNLRRSLETNIVRFPDVRDMKFWSNRGMRSLHPKRNEKPFRRPAKMTEQHPLMHP